MNPKPSQRVILAAPLENLFEECRLIIEKRSKLSSSQRDLAMARFKYHLYKGHFKFETESPLKAESGQTLTLTLDPPYEQ